MAADGRVVRVSAAFVDQLDVLLGSVPEAGRVLVAGGLLVDAFAVYGILMTDGSVERIGITIRELTPPFHPPGGAGTGCTTFAPRAYPEA